MADTISTGVETLDTALGGGLMPGSIVLVIGEPGTGKTTLLRNFICDGLKKDADCIYLLTNRSLDRVITTMSRSCDVSESPRMRFMLYNCVVGKRPRSLVGNFEDLIDIAYNCERIVSAFDSGEARMIIDDISYLFLMNSKDVVFKFLQRISQIMREKNVTCLVEAQKGMLDPQIITAIESMTDGTIETRREGNKRSLCVSRMEDESSKAEWIGFDISPSTGIETEAEKTLDEWQKILSETDSQEEEKRVKGLLKGIREKETAGRKKGLFK